MERAYKRLIFSLIALAVVALAVFLAFNIFDVIGLNGKLKGIDPELAKFMINNKILSIIVNFLMGAILALLVGIIVFFSQFRNEVEEVLEAREVEG